MHAHTACPLQGHTLTQYALSKHTCVCVCQCVCVLNISTLRSYGVCGIYVPSTEPRMMPKLSKRLFNSLKHCPTNRKSTDLVKITNKNRMFTIEYVVVDHHLLVAVSGEEES